MLFLHYYEDFLILAFHQYIISVILLPQDQPLVVLIVVAVAVVFAIVIVEDMSWTLL